MVAGHSSSEGTVHRYLKIVGSQAVAVSVGIGKKAALQLQMKQTLTVCSNIQKRSGP